jgi:uncharacterized protein YqjF (DUF2071 family)
MRQSWLDLLFAHWPVDAALLRPLVPPSLEIDTRDGAAWIGVVPFRMTLRFRGLPPIPGLRAFPEINVRTYVVAGGLPGVWFLSLDAANAVVVAAARRWFRLPYYRARMECRAEGGGVAYASRRAHPGAPPAAFRASYGPDGPARPAAPGTLEHWLCERYRLFSVARGGGILRGEVDHPPWELQPARATIEEETMVASHGLPAPRGAPLLHFSRRQVVRVRAPRPVAG